MKQVFSLFQSHLDLAHGYWSKLVQIGDTVIDATCGKGFDTLKLCQLALSTDKGKVYAIDNQFEAIKLTQDFLNHSLPEKLRMRIKFQQRCHSSFPDDLEALSVKLIVYNLGYLPGGDKSKTTLSSTTLQSLHQAQSLLQPGGVISVTCYPGHFEGALEQEAILAFIANLSSKEWNCCHHTWLNRSQAPTLLLIQKMTKANDSPITE